ncbi:TPA: hypothetical protein QCR75_005815 [Bacillus anthracis]|nr:hypothetical protein [Bacillus anthracis]
MDCRTVIIQNSRNEESFYQEVNNFIGKSNVKAVAINIANSGAWHRATITYLDLSSCKCKRIKG